MGLDFTISDLEQGIYILEACSSNPWKLETVGCDFRELVRRECIGKHNCIISAIAPPQEPIDLPPPSPIG